MLSTYNQIVKGEAQNWKRKKKRKLCNFLKQSIIFEGDQSNTGVHKQKHVQERKYEKYGRREFCGICAFQAKQPKIVSVKFAIFFFPWKYIHP